MNIYFRSGLCVWLIAFTISACAAPPPIPTSEPTTLLFAYLGHGTDYQRLAEEFHEQNPGISITLEALSVREPTEGFSLLIEQFQEVDVVRINTTFVGPDQLDAIHPLDEFIEGSENFPHQDIFPGSLEALQYEGRQLGLPAGLDPLVMFYENIRFTIASVTPPEADYTLDDFLASAQKVNNQSASLSSGKFAYGFCTAPLSDSVFIVDMFGGGLYDQVPAPTKPTLNRPANVAAISWYSSLWSEHALVPRVSEEPFQLFGQVSGTICGLWMQYLDMFGFAETLPVEARVLPFPSLSDGNAYNSPALVDGYFITRNSPHPELAWEWISYLMQHQEASLNQIPPMIPHIDSDEYAQRVSPDVLTVARRLPLDLPFLSLDYLNDPGVMEIANIFSQAVRQVIDEEGEVQSALDEAQKQAEEIFSSRGADYIQP
ncbi:MAG TPA: extracellular solute-binding protein [Anaerolineales bacterium]|nr:extracellular solute-binding protein [Anaerolineales bacterium]